MSTLAGIRVVDLTRILAGPFATMKLADHGAEVIKIEQPGTGDDTRGWGPPFAEGQSVYFLSVNRGKQSVTLDLKAPEGKRILDRLLATADVVVSNFRPGAMERLGYAYKRVAQLNPRIVYCSISGYGDEPDGKASYDVVVQGESGISALTGPPDGAPYKLGTSIADLYAGSLAVEGILLALLARQQTGRGQKIDIALLDGMLSLLTYQGQAWLSCGQEPPRLGNAHPSIVPYETFQTADGWINIGVASEGLWKAFCEVLGRPELIGDPRFALNADRVAHRDELLPMLRPVIQERSSADWLHALEGAGIPCGPIRTVGQVLADPARLERDMVVHLHHAGHAGHPHPGHAGHPHPGQVGDLRVVGNPVKLSDNPAVLKLPPPALGEHTARVLAGLGLSEREIEDLRAQGVV